MKNWLSKHIQAVIIVTVLIIAIAGVSVSSMEAGAQKTSSASLQGSVNAKEISINTKVPGRIVKFYVEEGQEVKAGDPIVEISSDELQAKKQQLEAQIQQAQAGVDASKAVLEMAESNYNISLERVEQARAGVAASKSQRDMASAVNTKAENGARSQEVAQAESAYQLYASTYERAKVLYDGGALSLQKLEEIETQRDVAQKTMEMAKEGARSEDKAAAEAQLAMTQSGIDASQAVLNQALEASNAAFSQISQAKAGLTASQGLLDQAKAGLMEVEVYLDDTLLTAPMDGTITALNSDEGELVSTGTSIGTLTDLKNCWVTVNIDEDKIASITEGQKVDIGLLAYEGQSFEGTVVTINKQPDFAIKKATGENGNFDIVSFGVKIELNNEDNVLRPGMTAVVDFD